MGARASAVFTYLAASRHRHVLFSVPVVLSLVIVGTTSLKLAGMHTGDSPRYLKLTENLALHRGFSAADGPPYSPEVFRAPAYPAFLALLLKFNVDRALVPFLQLLLLYGGALLVVARSIQATWDARTAFVAALILSLYGPVVRWMVAITPESLVTFLMAVAGALWVRVRERPHPVAAASLAICLASLFYTRTEWLVLLPLVVFDLAWRAASRPRSRRSIALALVVVTMLYATAVVPWMRRNYVATSDPSAAVGVGGGMTLWIRALQLEHDDPAFIDEMRYWDDPDFSAVHEGHDPVKAAAADRRLRARAMETIRKHYGEYVLESIGSLFVRSWIEVYSPDSKAPMLWVVRVSGTALLFLSYAGLWVHRRRLGPLLPYLMMAGAVTMVHACTGTEARYTAPFRPVLYPFAASVLLQWWDRTRVLLRRGRSSSVWNAS